MVSSGNPKPQSTIRIWSLYSYKYILRVTSSSPPSDKNLTVSGCISSVFCVCFVVMNCPGRLDTHFIVVRACQTGGSMAFKLGWSELAQGRMDALVHVHLVEKASELSFDSSI